MKGYELHISRTWQDTGEGRVVIVLKYRKFGSMYMECRALFVENGDFFRLQCSFHEKYNCFVLLQVCSI